jgi:glycosyltransferase involved in cell wall biosynthesis
MAVRILELRSVFGTGGGPEKTILIGTARTDPARYRITVCYLRDRRDPVFSVDHRASELGVDYVEVVEKHSFDPSILSALRRIVRDRAIDIVHAHDYKTNLLALLLRRTEGIIPLTTLHGYTGSSWKERLYYFADRRLVKRFPRVITVSRELTDRLLSVGARPESVETILNGIDADAFTRVAGRSPEVRRSFGIAPGDVVVGSIGRLERQKRFDVLIDAVHAARSVLPDLSLRLIIAGSGSLLEDLRRHCDRLGLRDACVFPGHVSDVARLHHAFDLFVQSSDYEGTPNAVLEAMAMQTPLIATDAGGTADLVRNGTDGIVIPAGSVQLLTDAICGILSDSRAATTRAASARRRVEGELSFAVRMARVERVYDWLIESHASTRQVSATKGAACAQGDVR